MHDFQSLDPDVHVQKWTPSIPHGNPRKHVVNLLFTERVNYFLPFLMNRCTKGAVRLVFDHLEKRLGTYEFLSVFEYTA